jgi:hypothetical protein
VRPLVVNNQLAHKSSCPLRASTEMLIIIIICTTHKSTRCATRQNRGTYFNICKKRAVRKQVWRGWIFMLLFFWSEEIMLAERVLSVCITRVGVWIQVQRVACEWCVGTRGAVPTLWRGRGLGGCLRWCRRRTHSPSRPTMLAPQGPHDLHAPISRTQRYKKVTCTFSFSYTLHLVKFNFICHLFACVLRRFYQ